MVTMVSVASVMIMTIAYTLIGCVILLIIVVRYATGQTSAIMVICVSMVSAGLLVLQDLDTGVVLNQMGYLVVQGSLLQERRQNEWHVIHTVALVARFAYGEEVVVVV